MSIVLKNLGIASTALGFTAGFTGDEIIRELENTGISQEFIRLEEGISRINVKLRSIDGTEINGRGPEIKKERLKELTDRLCRLQRGDVLFLSGSIPVSVPENIYSTIMQQLKDKGVMIVVDATKDLLMNVLPYHPFLIKPNNHELGEIFGVELKTRQEVVPYGKKLQGKGGTWRGKCTDIHGRRRGCTDYKARCGLQKGSTGRKTGKRRWCRGFYGGRIYGRMA